MRHTAYTLVCAGRRAGRQGDWLNGWSPHSIAMFGVAMGVITLSDPEPLTLTSFHR